MYRSLLSAGLLAIALQAGAQSYVHQVVVLNEGYFDYFGTQEQVVPVTLGSYDPATGTYQTVVTLEGPRFGSHVIVSGSDVFVAADDRVLRFSADDFSLLDEVPVTGVRKLAVWNDQLLLTRGELGGVPHHFEARDRTTLELLYTLGAAEGLPYSVEDVLVVGDEAYLAVNNAFEWADVQGRIGVVDLTTGTYAAEVDLGPDGLNPEKLFLRDGSVFAFNNKDFTGSSISRVEVADNSLAYTANVATNSGCASSVMADDAIYFMEYAQDELARFSISTGQVQDTLAGSPAVYGLVSDPVNNVLYATTTDFLTSGELHVLDLQGAIQSSVAVGVAPGNLALDIRAITGLEEAAAPRFGLYPNPATEQITFSGVLPEGPVALRITDATGRLVYEEQRSLAPGHSLPVQHLRTGLYTLQLDGGAPVRFSKQ